MKKMLCLLMFLLTTTLFAQESDKAFSYSDEWMVHTKAGIDWIFLRGEVEIKGLTYRSVSDKEYYYRQDGDKVYRYTMADGKEQVVLDYGLQVGDIFPLCEGFSLQVEAVSDTTIVFMNWDDCVQDSISCKRLHLKGVENPSFRDEWVEMFGSMRYGINPPAEAGDLGQTHLMYAISGEFIHMCDFNLPNVWGMEAVLGEEYPRSGDEYIAEDPLVFTLRNDTLHVGGYIRNDCDGPLYMLLETESENITLSTYELPLDADCYSFFKIDVSLPGFSQDRYIIKYGGRTFEVIQGNVHVESIGKELLTTPYYDLMGRPVNHPTRGIYIKDGKNVVIQ